MSTEHPERERLAHILRNAASAWWSGEELNSPMTELEQRHWAAWSDAILALLRPEAASLPVVVTESRSGEVLHRSFEAASPPEGREREVREGRGALDISDRSCREIMDLYAVSSNWGEAMVATLAAEVLRLRARAAPVDRGLVERLRGRAEWIDRKLPFTSLVFVELRRDFMTATADDLREAAAALERAPEPLSEPIVRWGDHEYRDGQWHPPLERAPEARAGEVTDG